MLHVYCLYSLVDIPSGSKLLFDLFSVLRVSRAAQIFILEFSKDNSAKLGDEFIDDGFANQPVILQEVVGLGVFFFTFFFYYYLNSIIQKIQRTA